MLRLPARERNSGEEELRRSRQKIDVGFGDEIFSIDLQGGEQIFGNSFSFRFGLPGPEHDFELQEISQSPNAVEVYAGLANQVEGSFFFDFADAAESLVENFEKRRGVGSSRDEITRRASLGEIGPFIANQLSAVRSQNSKLEARAVARKEKIFLPDQFRTLVGEARGNCFDTLALSQDRLDFDIGRHDSKLLQKISR
jgi:hypothetical protein